MSLATLTFEVGLTRAFSVLLRYHFVFLAISLATCGLGVGGLLDFLALRRRGRRAGTEALAPLALGAAVAFAASIALLFSPPMAARLTSLAVVGGICIVPFILVGAFLSHAFAAWSAQGGRLYFYDLSGAALGSCVVIIALQLVGATNVPLLCGVLAAAAATATAAGLRPRLAGAGLGAVLAAGLIINLRAPFISLPAIPPSAGHNAKPLFMELGDPNIKVEIVHTRWNAFARTDVVRYARPDGRFHDEDELYVYTDGEVPTNIIPFNGDLQDFADHYGDFIGFFPFRTARPDQVLLIGPGGGLDVLMALAAGASNIEGAELNPSMLPIVRHYRDFAGPVYDYSNVHVRVEEGRSYVRRSDRSYDLIYMALTKTATTASSSLALVESYVHTVEGFQDYLRHLSDNGRIAVVCQHPLVLMRLYLTAREALVREGVPPEQALRHLAALSVPPEKYRFGPYRHLLMVGRRPLAPERSAELARQVIALGLVPVFFPGAYEPEPFAELASGRVSMDDFVRHVDRWWSAVPVNVAPCTDDRPFVIDFNPGIPPRMRNFTIGVFLLVVLFSAVTIIYLARERGGAGRGLLTGAVVYFCLLGAGYMLVEVCLAQKLILYLGYPALTLSVILFSLLVGSGAGSLFSQRWPRAVMFRAGAWASLGVAAGIVVLMAVLPPLLNATLAWPTVARCLVAMLILMPLGFAMGTPFPTGLREVGSWPGNIVPWAWGINGVASVLGSLLAMLLAKFFGFQTVLLGGAAVYAVVFALAAFWSGRRDGLPAP
ncbi:MAG: hypothetical protein J7M38_15700 [Armatimonadetes bacterium]|nr:hypothetical protein [Armatimonadota bacterium]